MLTSKRLIVAFLLATAVLVAWPAVADLVVSYTLRRVTINDMTELEIRRGSEPGQILAVGYFEVKDTTGAVRETGTAAIELTTPQANAIVSFINSSVVPAFNAQRGL